MNMRLSKLWVILKDREVWYAAIHRVTMTGTWPSDWKAMTNTLILFSHFLGLSPSQGFCIAFHTYFQMQNSNLLPLICMTVAFSTTVSVDFGNSWVLLSAGKPQAFNKCPIQLHLFFKIKLSSSFCYVLDTFQCLTFSSSFYLCFHGVFHHHCSPLALLKKNLFFLPEHTI